MNEELTPEIGLPEASVESEEISEGENPLSEENSADGILPEQEVDFAAIADEDLSLLREEFPELSGLDSLKNLPNPGRFGELREMGLSPREAYLATARARQSRIDNRAHLHSSVPRFASGQANTMSGGELAAARDLFGNMTDTEIQKLYKRVTK